MNRLTVKSLFAIAFILSLFGCGGGGGSDAPSNTDSTNTEEIDLDITTFEYTGNDSHALVTSLNLNQLAYAVTETIKNLGLNDVMIPSEVIQSTRPYPSGDFTPLLSTDDPLCIPTGISDYIHNEERTINKYSFADCPTVGRDRSSEYFVTGMNTIVHEDSAFGPFVSVFDGEILDESGYLARMHHTLRCDLESCRFVTDFFGNDGFVYRMTDLYRTSQGVNTGIEVSGRAYHPDHGYVVFETDPGVGIDLQCTNTQPSSGVVTFSGKDNSQGSVEFISCTQYVVTNGLTSYVVDW